MNRLRSLGLLLLFAAIYALFITFVFAVIGRAGIETSSAVMLLAAVAIGWFLLIAVERRPASELGLAWTSRTPRDWLNGLLWPCVVLGLVVLVFVLIGLLQYRPDDGTFAGLVLGSVQLLLVLAIPAAAEEALFRGYPFQKLVEAIGPIAATVLASGGFAIAHRHNPGVNAFALINIFLAGVMLSVAYLRTRSLWLPIALHLGWNWQMAGPLDLPVSGLELFDAPLYEPHSRGAEWLTGGGFGPEGGLAGLVALLLITAAVWKMTDKRIQAHD
ncbi:MAG TPA: CPBP family intramembrane glutamic endopeptidase [Longimicrobiales bacterium]